MTIIYFKCLPNYVLWLTESQRKFNLCPNETINGVCRRKFKRIARRSYKPYPVQFRRLKV